jgi:hypothetical protein
MKMLSKCALGLSMVLSAAAMPLTAAGTSGTAGTVYRKPLRSTALVVSARGQGTAWVVNRTKVQEATGAGSGFPPDCQ